MTASARHGWLWILGLWIVALFVVPPVVNSAFRVYHYLRPTLGTMHFEAAEVSPEACSSLYGAQALTTNPCVVKARFATHPLTGDFAVFLDNGDVVMMSQSRRPWMISFEPRKPEQ